MIVTVRNNAEASILTSGSEFYSKNFSKIEDSLSCTENNSMGHVDFNDDIAAPDHTPATDRGISAAAAEVSQTRLWHLRLIQAVPLKAVEK